MEKIVDKGVKIDLHIHSVFSNKKDGKKVQDNTLDNVPILVNKLIENNVELCSITDHDTFNYEIYKKLKEEEEKENCIKKVLPGIEFSVEFVEGKEIHIVTIFDDKDDGKVKNIEKIMTEGNGEKKYKKGQGFYTKYDYFEILNEINIDFIMIAHQKKSIISEQAAHKRDVMSLGKETFNELVFMDYFDAYEFRSKRNEIYNKAYINQNQLEENLRFITGSDCHDWKYYPNSKACGEAELRFTYVKALATFKGLTMAVTDYHRISYYDKFFNPVEKYVEKLLLEINEEEIEIPMSKGINVIIGDNSIGKSLFLHALTNNYKISEAKLKRGYNKYLQKNKILIKTSIPENEIFMFNKQGEIRDIFDKEGMKPNKYLEKFYPNPINGEKYRAIIERELQRLYNCLEEKFSYDKQVKELPDFELINEETIEKSLSFIGEMKRKKIKELQELVDKFSDLEADMCDVLSSKALEEQDKKHIENVIEMWQVLAKKYIERLQKCKKQNEKINVYNTYVKNYKIDYAKKITDEQAVHSNYVETKRAVIQDIYKLILQKQKIAKYTPDIKEINVVPECNPVDKYKFVSKIDVEKLDNEYIKKLLMQL